MRAILLFFCALFLNACALEYDVPPATAGPLDSAARAAGLSAGKVKFNGPVTFQVVNGTGNTTTAAALTKPEGALATGPGATAGTTTRTGIPTWQIAVGGAVLLLLLTLWLVNKFRPKPLGLSTTHSICAASANGVGSREALAVNRSSSSPVSKPTCIRASGPFSFLPSQSKHYSKIKNRCPRPSENGRGVERERDPHA